MNQLKYAYEDIKNNIGRSITFFAQMTLSLLIFSIMMRQSLNLEKLIERINQTINHENTYMMFDVGDMDKFMNETIYQSDIVERMDNFYQYLSDNSEFQSYSFKNSDIILSDEQLDSSLALYTNNIVGKECYSGLIINNNFIDYFDLELYQGRIFCSEDYLDISNIIPVIVGYDYTNYLQLGNIIDSKYKIIGFMKKGSIYYDIKARGDLLSLDKTIVMPFQKEKAKLLNNIGIYDEIINKTLIITEDKNVLNKIKEKSSDLDLYTYSFRSVNEQLDNIKESINEWVLSLFTFCIIILCFCIIGMICNMLQMLHNYLRELGIHILCGARKISIVARLFYQIFFLTFLPNIIILCIYGLSTITLMSIYLSILLSLIVIFIPFYRLMNTDMNVLLSVDSQVTCQKYYPRYDGIKQDK